MRIFRPFAIIALFISIVMFLAGTMALNHAIDKSKSAVPKTELHQKANQKIKTNRC